MIQAYKCNKVIGCDKSRGNAVFVKHSNRVLVPVYNRVNEYNLGESTFRTLQFQTLHSISHLAISPDGAILIAVDVHSASIIYNLTLNYIVAHFKFKGYVGSIQFSRDSKILAVGIQHGIKLYRAPSGQKTFEPLIPIKKIKNLHSNKLTGCSFSTDNRFVLTWSKDLLIKFLNIFPIPEYVPLSFSVHKQKIIGCWITQENKVMFSCDKGGNLYQWRWIDDYLSQQYIKMQNAHRMKKQRMQAQQIQQKLGQYANQFQKRINHGRYILQKKYSFSIVNTKIKNVCFMLPFIFLLAKNGSLAILQTPLSDIENPIQQFMTQFKGKHLTSNSEGNWICITSQSNMLVYQWKSTTAIFSTTNKRVLNACISKKMIIGGGQTLAAWDRKTGMCISVMSDKQIVAVHVKQDVLCAASIQGIVYAYDLNKYKCFRVLKTDRPVQLTSVAIDNSCEIVCASGYDPYQIYCWNLQTSNLLQVISGHQSVITMIKFNPIQNTLLSSSWDNTLRVHNIFANLLNNQILLHSAQVTCFSIRKDGKEYVSCTMRGQIYFWSEETAQCVGIIDCKLGIQLIKGVEYINKGGFALICGKSGFVFLYDIKHRILLQKFSICKAKDLQNNLYKKSYKQIKEGINLEQIDQMSEDSEYQVRKDQQIPGSKNFDVTKRNKKQLLQATCLIVSPSQDQFYLCTTVGLLSFSQPYKQIFRPYILQQGITIMSIPILMQNKQYLKCLLLLLNQSFPCYQLILRIPRSCVEMLISDLSQQYLQRLLQQLVTFKEDQLVMLWICKILQRIGKCRVIEKVVQNSCRLSEINKVKRQIVGLTSVLSNLQ